MRKGSYPKVFKATLATAAAAAVAVAPVHTKAESPTFTDVRDIPSHHFYEAVMKYTAAEMMSGYPDGTFKPGQNITRQDAAKLLALVLELDTKNVKDPGFKDLKKTSPYYGYIAALVEEGIISGYEDNTFRPAASLTRAQMAKIIVLGFELDDPKTTSLPFKDINNKQWHMEFVRALYANEITTGTTPTTFSPNALVTRGQMASFVFRSEAFLTPKVDENQIAVDEAAGRVKDASVTVARGPLATDEAKLAAVRAYVTSLITDKGVSVEVVQGKTDGLYRLTWKKGDAQAEREYAFNFEFAEGDRFVADVKVVNAKQVEVAFSSPVAKSTVLDSSGQVRNLVFTPVTGATVNPGQLTGTLSEDGKKLTITAQWIFDGEYAFKAADAIQAASGGKFEELTTILKATDNVGPKLVSGSAVAKTATTSFAVLFDEPVSATGAIAYVNDMVATVANDPQNPNVLQVTSGKAVSAGETATIKLLNVKDYKQNLVSPNPVETSVTIKTDTVAPTVTNVKVVGENRIELTYDKAMNISSFYRKARLVHSNGSVTNLEATAGKDAKTVVLTGAYAGYGNSNQAVLFVDADVKDTVGNSAASYSANVTLERDTTSPALATVEYKDGKVVAHFTEDISPGGNSAVTIIDQKTGVATPITLQYNRGPNAVISDRTLTIQHSLPNGTYQLRLPANTVVDKAGIPNSNTIAMQSFIVENAASYDNTRPIIVMGPNNPVRPGTVPGAEQTATYTAIDDDSGINLATVQDIHNYTWDGKALPAGSYITNVIAGTADRATSVNVTVHVPSESIPSTKTAMLTVHNIRDNADNTIATPGMGEVTFVSGSRPELSQASIAANGTLTLSFNKPIQRLDLNDFVITVNGQDVPPIHVELAHSNSYANAYTANVRALVGNDIVVGGLTQDVIYIDTNRSGRYDSGDILLEVVDPNTYNYSHSLVDVNLHSNSVHGLKVRLVQDSSSPVRDLEGNIAEFGREINVK
ncbi:S-layer glycoprotein protein, contains three N-terminal slh domains [Bacillus sp. OxB-1]|uniref:S-layer homology domain-containing protein n=1 Tax=Bacillus sp. (strain OxB-1) TaxID=98228 RepID=UPI00058216B2|nr:S-layer homology domain-containing protein [Bacillus sp. OxB-1]BAQ10002.1 S-layer glycoprotein protein, contains three N-terminal slh domains [Bacillus sp. OxB-1]